MDDDSAVSVIYFVDNSIIPNPDSVKALRTCQFHGLWGYGLICQLFYFFEYRPGDGRWNFTEVFLNGRFLKKVINAHFFPGVWSSYQKVSIFRFSGQQ